MTDPIAGQAPAEAAVPAAAPAPAAAAPGSRTDRFGFTGRTSEYFRIWIVNLFLTIATLGIYSAWAKVRKKRYLYGNTWVADGNFEYHGRPIAILKGRIIAFAAFAGYSLLTHFSPHLGAALLLAMMPAAPWLIVRSFAFNAANSSYRNLRFRFDGTYREAAAAVAPLAFVPILGLVLPEVDREHPPRGFGDVWYYMLTPVLVLLVYPYVMAKIKLLHVNRTRFGTARFECRARVGDFYANYVFAGLLFAGLVIAMGVVGGVSVVFMPYLAMAVVPLMYFVGGALLLGFVRSRITNLVFNNTRLEGGVSMSSTLAAGRLARIYAFNLAAIVLTLGFAVPWAVMRTARYRADCLALRHGAVLDSFVGAATRDVAATGEEVGEMFDVDLSL